MAPAVIVLAIMVLPTVAAISQDAFSLIPYKIKEAAYGMGTTKWEAITQGHDPDRLVAASSPRSCSASGARSARPWRSPC